MHLLYARSEQLGWDPTIRPTLRVISPPANRKKSAARATKGPVGKKKSAARTTKNPVGEKEFTGEYEIDVRITDEITVPLCTIEMLCDTAVDTLLSEGTRVWKAILLADYKQYKAGRLVTVKDYWAEAGSPDEGAALREILAHHPDPTTQRTHFVPVICTGDVHVGKVPDTTERMLRNGYHPDRNRSTRYTVLPDSAPDADDNMGTTGYRFTKEEIEDLERQPDKFHGPKIHRRSVYDGVMEPLYEKVNLHAVFCALAGACDGECVTCLSCTFDTDIFSSSQTFT